MVRIQIFRVSVYLLLSGRELHYVMQSFVYILLRACKHLFFEIIITLFIFAEHIDAQC